MSSSAAQAISSQPNFVILYVADPEASVSFYTRLLAVEPVEVSPTFALFVLESGLKLGLWKVSGVEPAALLCGGGTELVFPQASREQVDALCMRWWDQGVRILQQPTSMDFGYTFTAADPDDHRLRVFVMEM
ncbi:VOC family protein [Pokkaliibacter sp. MBI-7]|uniref:VOC family protein n=1 Tax=Pokkaliibacter sp. MBI-7 TaxID=3040600 RepID=UPI00244768F5|nr:VOC family protein [Pokkaliibacter sp. MBI-7]MDH2433930.1 VOC family protein [Pokkaliibacter sp. MBI-7]